MTERVVALTLAGDLAMAYPGRTVTEDHAGAWAQEFARSDESTARKARDLLLDRFTSPPSVADVRATLREVGNDEWRTQQRPPAKPKDALPPQVLAHGIHHLRRVMAGDHEDERDGMREPWRCDCGWTA